VVSSTSRSLRHPFPAITPPGFTPNLVENVGSRRNAKVKNVKLTSGVVLNRYGQNKSETVNRIWETVSRTAGHCQVSSQTSTILMK
jgi:hypothetical protein